MSLLTHLNVSETDLFRNGNCTYDFSGVLIKYGDMVFNKKIKCQKGCLRLVLNTILLKAI